MLSGLRSNMEANVRGEGWTRARVGDEVREGAGTRSGRTLHTIVSTSDIPLSTRKNN